MNSDKVPNIGIIILAAGQSRRMGKPKQLLNYAGQSLLARSIAVARQSEGASVTVVIGANACAMCRNIEDREVPMVFNYNWREGLSSSIRVGITALEREFKGSVDAAVLMLCDQPFVSSFTINRLIRVFRESALPVVASQFDSNGRTHVGVPALFSKSVFSELKTLSGPGGAKRVIKQHSFECAIVNAPEAAFDVDTPQDYSRMRKIIDEDVDTGL